MADDNSWQAAGENGVVVAGRTGSAEAGLKMLKSQGNAADAAAATILALSVTDSDLFCFGGEVPILIYDAKGKVVEVLCGQGRAPKLATRKYFIEAGGIREKTIQAAAIPAVLDACLTLLERYGTKTFAEVVAPAQKILSQEKENWHARLAETLQQLVKAETQARDRVQGLRLVADYFYRGPIAKAIDKWSRAEGGLIRYSDLATHVTCIEEPLSTTYRGYTVYKCSAWTQGPYLLQALKILEGFDLSALGFQQVDTIHVIIEALKLAMADRDVYFADPLFVDVPLKQLLCDEYAHIRRELIDMDKASKEFRPGDPRDSKAILDEHNLGDGTVSSLHDTTTFLTADRWGNMIAATPSGWSGVLEPETGIWFGSRLISFNTWAGHPNCIEPYKRPRITLTPSLVLKDGRPVMAISTAGDDMQDQGTLQIITNYIDFGLNASELVTTPRYVTDHYVGSFNQTPPKLAQMTADPRIGKNLIEQLKKRGHIINLDPSMRLARTVIVVDRQTNLKHGAGDPEAPIPRHVASC